MKISNPSVGARWRDFILNNTQRAIIFANGDSASKDFFRDEISDDDFIIAADGGTQQVLALGLTPNLIVGDLDSIQPELLNDMKNKGVIIQEYPSRKDETDLELALIHAKRLGIKVIVIHNALGARWDMTIANLLLLSDPEFRNLDISIMDGYQEIFLLQGETARSISGRPGDILSLIPIGGKAAGLTSYGLEYKLDNDTLEPGSPRGVSNVFLVETAEIHLKTGQLLCVHIKN